MVDHHRATDTGKDDLNDREGSPRDPDAVDEKRPPTGGKGAPSAGEGGSGPLGGGPLSRRSLLRLAGATALAGAAGAAGNAAASRDVSQGDGYEVWTISGMEVYDLSDGETLENVLVDQRADGACLTIRSRQKSGWTIRNVGFLGVGQAGDGANRFQIQVSCPAGSSGLIENIWASGKARDGQPSTHLGGIYIRAPHAGHIDIRHTYIEGFGNNAVYGSSVGKDNGNDGTITIENAYHRDNTSTQFRIGSPGSVVRNSVGVIDDPEGRRGTYPGTSSNRNARGIWGKHWRDQRFENCAFYTSPDDCQPDGVFEARYIQDRSHGTEAVAEVVDCHVNPDAPTLTGTTSNARINFTNLGESPTVAVIQDGGVPTSPVMAASGGREMPPELPGASGGSTDGGTGDTTDGSTGTTLDRTLTVDGTAAGYTEYTVTVSGELAENADVGSLGTGDVIDGSTATGFVNGGVDGYRFSGDVTELDVAGDAAILIDGVAVDPAEVGDADPTVSTGAADAVTDGAATLTGSLDSLGGAASADVAFEWRPAGASSWTATDAETLSAAGAFSHEVSGLSAETTYEYRAVVSASDGDTATGSPVQFTTAVTPPSEPTLDRTLTVDGTNAKRTTYAFTVSGDLAENPEVGSLGGADAIDGSTATGFVNGGVDGYRFAGELVDITVDGDATVLVDGQPLTGISLPNTLVFDGSDTTSPTTYAVSVSGELASDPTVGALEDGDGIDAGTVAGTVDAGDVDGFRFSGNVVSLRVDGEASVAFEDTDG